MASFGILENKDKLNAEIAEAKKSVSKQKRIDRELKKVQSGGRVSSFLKREAEKNEVLSASLGVATASDMLSMGQALIKYEDAINRVNISDELKTEDQPTPEIPAPEIPIGENVGDLLYWNGLAWVILPPPSGSALRVLATNGSVPFWAETEDC
jgi:hypothetical protein